MSNIELDSWVVVTDTARYILKGPSFLNEAQDPRGQSSWRIPIALFGKTTFKPKREEYLSIYFSPIMQDPLIDTAFIVRHAVWDREEDLLKRKRRSATFPNVAVSFFKSLPSETKLFNEHLKKFDSALKDFRFRYGDGLDIRGPEDNADEAPEENSALPPEVEGHCVSPFTVYQMSRITAGGEITLVTIGHALPIQEECDKIINYLMGRINIEAIAPISTLVEDYGIEPSVYYDLALANLARKARKYSKESKIKNRKSKTTTTPKKQKSTKRKKSRK